MMGVFGGVCVGAWHRLAGVSEGCRLCVSWGLLALGDGVVQGKG